MATSSRSAIAVAHDKPSRFSICRCRIHRRSGGSGSKPIVAGHEDAGRENVDERRRERSRREREQQAARERYLTDVAGRERQAWNRVDGLIGTKRPGDCASAVTLLVDLRDISARNMRAAARRSQRF